MHFELSIVIHRPVEIVFAYVADHRTLTKWGSVKEVQMLSQGAVGLGTTFQVASAFLGRKFEYTLEITAYEANQHFTVKNASGPFPLEFNYHFESAEGGTRLTMQVQFEPGGFFKIAGGLLLSQAKKREEGHLQRLKSLLEA